jgi:predicted HNH restriction endonuclease
MPLQDKDLAKVRQKTYSRTWYLKNRKVQIAKNKKLRKAKRKEWEAYKAGKKCAHCGFSHPAVIDFHHVIRKNKQSVNKLAAVRNNIPAAIKEAETKCIPLCSNCHRILHWKEHRR